MQFTLSTGSIVALTAAMLIGAAIPSVSVLTVSARSVSYGFRHGVMTSFGIVTGDVLFISIAIFGLSFLADTLGQLFFLIKILGGLYLLWLGILLWRAKPSTMAAQPQTQSSMLASYMAGLMITLGDQKAILFYLGFFPAFVDLNAMRYTDAILVMLIAVFAVGTPKLVYAYLASKAEVLQNERKKQLLNRLAALIMLSVGLFLLISVAIRR